MVKILVHTHMCGLHVVLLWFEDFGMLEICRVFMKYFPQLHSARTRRKTKGNKWDWAADDLTCQGNVVYMCIWHASASLLWLISIPKNFDFWHFISLGMNGCNDFEESGEGFVFLLSLFDYVRRGTVCAYFWGVKYVWYRHSKYMFTTQ